MNIELTNPYGFICLPFVLMFLWWSIKRQKGTVLKKSIIVSRILICLILIGALSGIKVQMLGKNSATVFLLDVSDSMRDFREEGVGFIQESLASLPKNHKASVIVFGTDSQMDKFLDERKTYSKVGALPTTSATNIEQAIQTALAYLPEEANKELVLITDGGENEGDMLKATELIKGNNIDLKAYKIGHTKHNEVYIDEITVPDKIYKNQSFSVVTKVVSNVKTKAKLTLFSGIEKKSEEWVELEVGENTFVFKDIQTSGGFKSYKAMINAEEDYEISNNEYSTFTTVKDAPLILVIEGKEGDGKALINVLEQEHENYKVSSAPTAPSSLEAMMAYKGIIMCNVYKEDLPKDFLNNLEGYVKSYGGSLIVTGGEDAYALGDYKGSVLETILPVDMHKKGQMAEASTSLCLVIDHSGSMLEHMAGGTKLSLSVQAAASVVDCLSENDEISVFGFDDRYTEIVKRQNVVDVEKIKGLIYGIKEGGGTSIYPALEAAYKSQLESNASVKHIILLTDGQDRFKISEYQSLIEQMNEHKITLSTVAMGNGANERLLNQLAEQGGGRNYKADSSSNVPHIFAKEFFLSSGEYLVNETFSPQVTSQHEVLTGVMDKGGFELKGYIGTSMKPLATQVLASHQGEPVLALWQYGLGKTVAWTSDASGEWSGPLFGDYRGAQLFKNILNWSMTTYEGTGEVSIEESSKGAKVIFKATDIEPNRRLKASYQSTTGKTLEKQLTEVSPGIYETEVTLDEGGFYAFNIIESLGDDIQANYISGFAKQYSKEYKFNNSEGKLEQLIEAVQGKLITLSNEVFKLENKKSYKTIELTNIFLILGIIWFLVDVIIRRFKLSMGKALVWVSNMPMSQDVDKPVSSKVHSSMKDLVEAQINQQDEVKKKTKTKEKQKLLKKPKTQASTATLDTATLLKSKKERNE